MTRFPIVEYDENIAAPMARELNQQSVALDHAGNGAQALQIDRTSRILFFAPHPDDESLAGGGLLQRAAAAGAVVRVIFLTNGENNPWPHRVVEKQWTINAEDRALWGMRRRDEALEALETLGLEPTCAHFLNAPDQGLTQLLLEGGPRVIAQLRKLIATFQPTLLIAPARFDLHPDHSALSVLLDFASSSPEFQAIRRFFYAVHNRESYYPGYHTVCLDLSPLEQQQKQRAIKCHRSQMILSKRRFLGHVKDRETFWVASPPQEVDETHPVRSGNLEHDVLNLLLRKPKRAFPIRGSSLYLALQGNNDEYARWKLKLPNKSGKARLSEIGTDVAIAQGEAQFGRASCRIRIPLGSLEWSISRIFIKHQPFTLFYDVAGWREIPVEVDVRAENTGLVSKYAAVEATV